MATLKTIVTEYINLMDKPFDIALYRRVRQLILNQRAFELTKDAERYGVDNRMIQYITPEFETVNLSGDITIGPNEVVIRSVNKILRNALFLSHEAPFHYVGAVDLSVPFMHVNNYHVVSRLRNVKHFARTPLYYVIECFVYCVVPKGTKSVTIGNVWHDPGAIDLENGYLEDEYFDDDYEFLISPDMLQVIKEKLLRGELQVLGTDDKEVKLNNDEPTVSAPSQH